MTTKKGTLPLKRTAMQRTMLMPLLILTLFGTLSWFPDTGCAEQESPVASEQKQSAPEVVEQKPRVPEVVELKLKAQQAYMGGRYAEAAAANLEIAERFPGSKERRYAVQMLGTLYEDNLVNIKKAVKWDREFLKKYADPRQVSFYQEKLASLEKMMLQEQAFKTYQTIRFANKGDEVMVKKLEQLLQDQPDFLLKVEVERELGNAYARLDKRRESYQAFQAIAQSGAKNVSTTDRVAIDATSRYWQMTSTWGRVAWGVVALLWVAVLLMKPWQRLSRTSIRTFLILALLWVLLTALRMPTFYAISTDADRIILNDSAVYIAAGLNLTVLFWILLLTRGQFWQSRPRALRWLSPVLTLLMTTAVFYLFIIYLPNGPETTDVFAVKYQYLMEVMRDQLHL